MNYFTILDYATNYIKSEIQKLCDKISVNGLEDDYALRLSFLLKDFYSLQEEFHNRIEQNKLNRQDELDFEEIN